MRPMRMLQSSFTSGELAPTVAARVEVARYYAGAALMKNVLVRPQGGFRRRPGMLHVYSMPLDGEPSTFDGSTESQESQGWNGLRAIPFAFNTTQTYLIVLTEGRALIIRSDGVALTTIDFCPWYGDEAAEFNWAQSADTLLLFHRNHPPQRIRRGTLETDWTRDVPTLANIPTTDFGAGAEAVISSARGWPSCGTFHKARLYLGGLKSLPASFLFSRTADFFNLNIGTAADDDGFFGTIDSDQVNAIHQITSGRALQIFTSGAELVVDPPDGVITPKSLAVLEQTRRGIQPFARTAEVDGANLFIQGGGAAIRQFLFSDAEAAWRSDLVSLLAPHLVLNPSDVIVRKGVAQDDADYVLLPNRSTTMAVMTTLRAQEVAAFTRWTTEGRILAAAALASGEVYFVVERANFDVDQPKRIHIERWSSLNLLDAAVRRVEATPFTTLAGTGHLKGEAALILDGAYQGLVAVNGASSITLPRPAREAQLGLFFQPRVTTMPLEPRDATGNLIGRRSRIKRLTARVDSSGAFSMQGQAMVQRTVGGPPAPPMDTPPPIVTGDVQLRGLVGWRERHAIDITQPVPGPLEVLAIATELEVGE